jgi:stearoyl-CoA desaturase (delta-9 desaturase)
MSQPYDMTKIQRWTNLFAVVLPFVAFLVAIPLLWNRAVDGVDLALMAVMYFVTALGITVGYHRLFTHRSFQAARPVQYGLAGLGSMAVQGPLASWVADHRKHHAHTDEEGDPHSPHGHGPGLKGMLQGLWHAHVGWLVSDVGQADRKRYARDVIEDPGLLAVSRSFELLVVAGFLIPALAGFLIKGTLVGALTALLWAGLVRVFFVHHITWSINSVCHFFGRRRFEVDDHSTNVAWLALPSLGEAWHHNHHAFPRSAEHGLRWRELDVSALVIRGLERLGLASNVVRISPERQEAKLAGAAPPLDQPAQAGQHEIRAA